MSEHPDRRSPLTPLTYQILVALADGARHGYGIIKEIAEQEGEAAAPSTGALYLAIQRMESDGLIEETRAPSENADARRRYYRITENGLQVARLETERLTGLVATARSKDLVRGPAS